MTVLTALLSSLRKGVEKGEDAQALIFFGVVAMALALTTGLAIEGGRAFVEYRKVQAAADMAALVGAQALPCNTSDSTCMQNAETLACQIASNNGFGGCSNGGAAAPAANVPPVSCSPYDSIDYGNDNGDPSPYGNSNCKSVASGVSYFDYIEVRLTDNLGTIPIFNVPVTLAAHAVARHGVPSPKDYAVSQLQPWQPGGKGGYLSVSNNSTFFVHGSTFANGWPSYGTGTTSCEGGFFTASATAASGTTYTTDPLGLEAGFAPPQCYTSTGGTPMADSPPNAAANLPLIADPYCSSYSPPITQVSSGKSTDDCSSTPNTSAATQVPNCPDCNNYGLYTVNGKWQTDHNIAGSGGGAPNTYEMWPGVYNGFALANNDMVYMNPGIYTFTGQISLAKGNVCVYGSPSCMSGVNAGQCEDTSLVFKPGEDAGNKWFYNCSPYGYWDQVTKRPPAGFSAGAIGSVACPDATAVPSCTPPTWWDTSKTNSLGIFDGKGGVGSVPLNGFTMNMVGSSFIKDTGAGTSNLGFTMASPNPCPGTGPIFVAGPGASARVSFNPGNSTAYYSYTATSANPYLTGAPSDQLAYSNGENTYYTSHQLVSGWGSLVYPSMDLTIPGECAPNTFELWPGEFAGKGQHLHFAIFNRTSNDFNISGNNGQSFYGIWYTPHANENILGGGKAGGGPPWIEGQIVTWNIKYGGASTIDLIYRPCNTKQDVCASGLGTELIQ